MKISIVIPAFNEADTIEATLNELKDYMNSYTESGEWEIIVINDGSTDNTIDILNSLRVKEPRLKAIDLGSHYGRGRALREGLRNASGDIIISLDADLSYAPYHIERMIKKIKEENADIVLASAYYKDGSVKNVPLKRLWISKLGNKLLSYMFGGNLTVFTCLARAYRKDFIERLDLYSDDKEIHLEILYKTKMLGGRIVEVPADLCWRQEKLLKAEAKGQDKRRSTIEIRKTSSSHLFFAMLNKPGLIFLIPGYMLSLLSVYILFFTLIAIAAQMKAGLSIFQSVRMSMLTAIPSWLTMSFSFVIALLFFMLGFLTNQNKRNYEETYRTLNTILLEFKKGRDKER